MNRILILYGARLLPAIAVLMFVFAGLAGAAPGERAWPQPEAVVEGVSAHLLPNGLRLLLVPDAALATTTVNVSYRVGSRTEGQGETGMAHAIEHLLFRGSTSHTMVHRELSRRGIDHNASTTADRTSYLVTFLADDDSLRWFLAWQADAMFNSLLSEEDLRAELSVIRNEMDRADSRPTRVLIQRAMAVMYDWHGHGKATLGNRSDLDAIDLPRLRSFYSAHYRPENVTIVVCGRFDPDAVLRWTLELFGGLRSTALARAVPATLEAAQDGERTVLLRRAGGTSAVAIGHHLPPAAHPDFAAATLLAGILGAEPGGRIHRSLVQTGRAAGAFGYTLPLRDPSLMLVGVTLAAGDDVDAARAGLLEQLAALATDPISDDELRQARKQWLDAWTESFADPETIAEQLADASARGDWRLHFLQRDQVRAVRVEDLRRVANDYLGADNRTVATYLPAQRVARAPAPQRVDIAQLLAGFQTAAAAPSPAADPDPVATFWLAAGMRASLLVRPNRGQTVQARLRLNFGSPRSLAGLSTVASLAGLMIERGGAGLGRHQIADRFREWNAEVQFRPEGQTLTIAIATRREHLPSVVDLVGRLLREPAFDERELAELGRQSTTLLQAQQRNAGALLANATRRHFTVAGRGEPGYTATFDEGIKDITRVQQYQLVDFHRRFYSAAHAEFAAVGDFDAAVLRQALVARFGEWHPPASGGAAYERIDAQRAAPRPGRIVIDVPDQRVAHMRVEVPLPVTDSHADHAALQLVDYILGQATSSRLWVRLRDREGLCYSIESSTEWNPLVPNSHWVIAATFDAQDRARLEAALVDEIERARAEGFTPAELELAKAGLLTYRRLWRTQDASLSVDLARNLFLGRDLSFASRIDEALAKATLDHVNGALRRYIQPADWLVGFAGAFGAP